MFCPLGNFVLPNFASGYCADGMILIMLIDFENIATWGRDFLLRTSHSQGKRGSRDSVVVPEATSHILLKESKTCLSWNNILLLKEQACGFPGGSEVKASA